METKPLEANTTSTAENVLSFQTAVSSISDPRTQGTDEINAEVHPEVRKVNNIASTLASPGFSSKQRAEDCEAISVIHAKSYKIHTSIGLNNMYSQEAILDTGCGPCLIRRSTVRPEWLTQERLPPLTQNMGATRSPVRITCLMDLDLQIGDLRKSITFAIVDDLAVSLLMGTAYQDRFIDTIKCKARRLKPINNRTVAILDSFNSPVCTMESEDNAQPR